MTCVLRLGNIPLLDVCCVVLRVGNKFRDAMLHYAFHVGSAIVSLVMVAVVVIVSFSDVNSETFETGIIAGGVPYRTE